MERREKGKFTVVIVLLAMVLQLIAPILNTPVFASGGGWSSGSRK